MALSGRPAAVFTICYYCGDKGHYARHCPDMSTELCNFCNKQGHKEKACRAKAKANEVAGGRDHAANEEVSLFHGSSSGECHMVDFSNFTSLTASTTKETYAIPML